MNRLIILFFLSLSLIQCRKEDEVITSTEIDINDTHAGEIKGFFLLNEGKMGSNKASLDFLDAASGKYYRNIYAERNPDVVKELGDVGNDIQIYENQLFAVINSSNMVEVMDVRTARHIGQVSIPNCRYITFHDGYAYVSSYAGPIGANLKSRLGYVAKIDTQTLQIVDTCVVGYQPEEMCIVGQKLYVANSGGYMSPNYDDRVSIIDLNNFKKASDIKVGVNLHHMKADRHGYIYVSSRGDYASTPSKTFILDTKTNRVIKELPIVTTGMTLCGDSLYIYGTSDLGKPNYTIVNTLTRQVVNDRFITDGTETQIKIPYGIAVNPESKDIYITDAIDYVNPGKLYCYSPTGKLKWQVTTGDIPAHIVFTRTPLEPAQTYQPPTPTGNSPYITRVFDYRPAPGQHVNKMPEYSSGDTQADMNQKVLKAIGNNQRTEITLGGYGGYVIVGFDHTIRNVKGKYDFRVLGNAYIANANPNTTAPIGGGCEPGIVMVSADTNKNGLPDDEWFELWGSAHVNPTNEAWYEIARTNGNDMNRYFDYSITYHRPELEFTPTGDHELPDYLFWEDNKGRKGALQKNRWNLQPYYPQWIADQTMTFSGTRLPQNVIDESHNGTYYVGYRFHYGYADNATNTEDGSCFDISWAHNSKGNPVQLDGIDFIKVYTGVNQTSGWMGEISTEIQGISDLHLLKEDINSIHN